MTFNNHLKASNSQEVTKRSHYASLSQSVCFPSSNPSNPINPDYGNGINPHYRNIPKIYFTTIKKQNTFYLRVLHRDTAQNESVTVSLRTNNRREAMMNTDYLKERLLEQAGSFVSFDHMRAALKEIAQTELVRRPKVDWFYRGNIIVAQEALQEAQTVEQVRFIQSYSDIMKKGLQSDTEGLLSIVDSVSEVSRVSESTNVNSERSKHRVNNVKTFSQMVEDYINEKEVSGSWTTATLGTKAATVRKLVSYFEACSLQDKTIDQITRQDLLEVRTALSNDGLKLSTVNGQIRNIVAVFKYAELLDVIPKSPAVKLLLKDRENKDSKALTESEVNNVLSYFKHGYFTEAKRSKKTIEAMKFIKWIPQLAAITGARLNEILQLRKGDIKQSDNGLCWFVDINDKGDNVLKNKSSARVVPLVNGAYGFDLELFLNEVVNTCNDDSDNIFRLKNSDRQLNSIKIGKLLKAYRDNHSEAPETLTMHSFRHTMATLCLNKKMPESFAKEILGHTQSITYGLYGSAGVDVETMYKEMVKLWS
ncbi:tyrosine-type recombinase/integrase [Vibrio cholerae]|nr:tyrosine-type recombinase/integrase [Vibrio cholerae]EKO5181013.1 tyrosine-type recombinase/integrase [Vibrio cholerae]ELF1652483.1 tyrosine-type recombinase/integrase [Vibrio cholerae]ELJ8474265.1 tyrosine-type recombinase/integrase [Vibrio cholerae]ELJ8617108.1 tyrosine-type recombinase/integrase [Vibrio cholerae]